MKKWVYILMLFPMTAMAGESGFAGFLGKIFPQTTANVNSTVDAVKAPASGMYLQNKITETFAPTQYPQQQQQAYPTSAYPYQQAAPAQTYAAPAAPGAPAASAASAAAVADEQEARKSLVRCMRMGALTELHTALSDQSVESQAIASRSAPLYAKLNCNDVLKDYTQLIKQVDDSVKACAEDDGCTTAQLPAAKASGGLKK